MDGFIAAASLLPPHCPQITADTEQFDPDWTGFPLFDMHAAAAPGYAVAVPDFPVSVAGRAVAGFPAHSYYDDYYNRIHASPLAVDVGAVTARQQVDIHIWNAYLSPQLLDAATGDDEGATLHAPHALPSTMAPLQEDIYALEILPLGSFVIDLALVWDFHDVPDATVRVVGRRAVVFSFPPDWSSPVIETFEWMTNILTGEAGTEQRRALRRMPRMTTQARHLVVSGARQYLDILLSRWAGQAFALPLWADIQHLTIDVPAGATFIHCNTSGYAFQAGELAALIRDDAPMNAEAAEVLEVTPTGLTLRRPLGQTWLAGARLYPCRMAELAEAPERTRMTDKLDTLEPTFHHITTEAREGALPALIYRGWPVFLARPDESRDLSYDAQRIAYLLDNEVGLWRRSEPANRVFQTRAHRFLLAGRAAVNEFLRLGYGLAGRQKAIWVPTHADDLTPALPTQGNVLPVKRMGYSRFGVKTPGRRDIAILLHDGTVYLRRVTDAQEDGDLDRLSLDDAFPTSLAPNDIARVSYLTLSRLDSDAISIEHITDNDGAARTELVFRAVPEDVAED
jgi:hypothetical protein